MRPAIARLVALGLMAAASAAASSATLPAAGGSPAEIATNIVLPGLAQRLICVYATGSQIHSCAITVITPQTKVGRPCYCGASPKGIIRAAPLLLSPG